MCAFHMRHMSMYASVLEFVYERGTLVYNVGITVVQVFQIHIQDILTASTHARISQQRQSVKASRNVQICALVVVLEECAASVLQHWFLPFFSICEDVLTRGGQSGHITTEIVLTSFILTSGQTCVYYSFLHWSGFESFASPAGRVLGSNSHVQDSGQLVVVAHLPIVVAKKFCFLRCAGV